MKPLLRIVLPPRGSWLPPQGSPARLPFLLVPVLAGMALVQLASPQRIALPPSGAVARVGVATLPEAPPVVIAPPLLANRDLFAPPARAAGADGPSDPLDGAVIAGVLQKGRLRLGVVQQPGGPGGPGNVRYVAVGGAVAGWRLAALDKGEARLTRGPGQTLRVTYGMRATPPKSANLANSPQTSESGQ